ncbi:MAG: DUF1499 domain-containing protein [Planctomycetes bacterium]|nr:DUF1499 domain-containing protein [Planctomycetota bacterium]
MLGIALVLIIGGAAWAACSSTRPTDLGWHDKRLAAAPSSPNCVSSQASASDGEHFIAPLGIDGEPARAWRAATEAAKALPGATVVTETDDYLWIECTSRFFRFVDDLELALNATEQRIEVRSASRLGWSDLGVNRKRVEALRAGFHSRLDANR